jgi:hypothetical protein
MGSPHRVFETAPDKVEFEEGFNTPPKPRKKKPWVVESRYIGPAEYYSRGWQIEKRYATEKSRDEALEQYNKKRLSCFWRKLYEYRKGEDETCETTAGQ